MSAWWAKLLGVALAASLAANAYLVWTRGGSEPALPEIAAPSESNHMSRVHRAPGLSEPRSEAHDVPVPADYAKLDRAQLEQRLAQAETKLQRYLPPHERFEQTSERSPASEARLAAALEKVFGTKPGNGATYDVECHGSLCKTTVHDQAAAPDWQQQVQSDPAIRAIFAGGMEFVAGKELTWYGALADPAQERRTHLSLDIALGLRGLPAVVTCHEANPGDSGDMTLHVTLDASVRRLQITADGPLASTPAGVCIRRSAEQYVAAIAIPTDVGSLPEIPIPISF